MNEMFPGGPKPQGAESPSGKPARSFQNPFEIPTPPGAEGWEEVYPYYSLLNRANPDEDSSRFWFFDGMHNPEPLYPFDMIMTENWWVGVSQMTSRVWPVPPALGFHHRVVNGYLYVSPIALEDASKLPERIELFNRRAGYYFENWDKIFAEWEDKAKDCIGRLKAIEFKPLPEYEPEESVFGHAGIYSSYKLMKAYNSTIENMLEMGSYHFEMLILGYGAYMTFREFCQSAFPGIADQTITNMVCGIENLLFRPDDELRRLAHKAVELKVDKVLLDHEDPEAALAALPGVPGGPEWLKAFEAAKEPWFWFSTGVGYCHADAVWMSDLRLPFKSMRGYIEGVRNGEDLRRPTAEILAKRERTIAEYRALLPTDEDRANFDGLITLATKVFPYVESHNFYVEHWHHSIFWKKIRELGAVFVAHNFFDEPDDIFHLHRFELNAAIYDLEIAWASAAKARGETHWRPIIARRKKIREKLMEWTPPPALGTPPEILADPVAVTLWGITREQVDEWLGVDVASASELRGVAASAGKVVGKARVITSTDQLYEVQEGEILVCRITAPSWAPVFQRIGAAVSDVGGLMAHTAIISREYGLPAVVGTGYASAVIKTGDTVEVDGDKGIVRVVEAA